MNDLICKLFVIRAFLYENLRMYLFIVGTRCWLFNSQRTVIERNCSEQKIVLHMQAFDELCFFVLFRNCINDVRKGLPNG